MNADELSRLIDELGQKFGPAAQHVYELAIRQQLINGVICAIFTVIVTLVATVTAVVMWRGIRGVAESNKGKSYPYTTDAFPYWFAGGLVLLICLLLLAVLIPTGLSVLLNPEYQALHDLLGAVR